MAVGFVFAAAPALAQEDPTPSVLRQLEQRLADFERESRIEQEGEPVLTDPVPRAELPPPGGPTITLRDVKFEPPSEFITEEELRAIAADYVGRPIDFSEIARLVRDVNDIYAERGVVTAAAILPPQDLDDRILTVQLVEGRLGNIALVGERRTSDENLLRRVRMVRGDRVVDVPTASRDITFSNRTSLLQMRMLLLPGAGFGLTDVALGITEPPRNQVIAYVDNQGVRSTGEISGGLIWRHYGALGIDDSMLTYLSASEGSFAGTVNYDLPINSYGTRFGVGYTGSRTKVVDGPIVNLGVTGSAHTFTATLSQPLVARTEWLVKANASLSYGLSESKIGPVQIVDTRTTRAVFGLPITYSQDTYSLFVQPQLILARVEDRLAETTRTIPIFAGNASAFVGIGDSSSLQLNGAWQYTNRQLLAGNLLFQIGGPTTVRGYPSDGIAGDSGYFVQTELHHRFRGQFEGLGVFAFADVGQVFSTFLKRQTLASAGFGASYSFAERVTLELSAAFPVLDTMADQSSATFMARLTTRLY